MGHLTVVAVGGGHVGGKVAIDARGRDCESRWGC